MQRIIAAIELYSAGFGARAVLGNPTATLAGALIAMACKICFLIAFLGKDLIKDFIFAIASEIDVGVVPGAALQNIAAFATQEDIISITTFQPIIAILTSKRILAVSTLEGVVAASGNQIVVAPLAFDSIIAAIAKQEVFIRTAINGIIPVTASDHITPCITV